MRRLILLITAALAGCVTVVPPPVVARPKQTLEVVRTPCAQPALQPTNVCAVKNAMVSCMPLGAVRATGAGTAAFTLHTVDPESGTPVSVLLPLDGAPLMAPVESPSRSSPPTVLPVWCATAR
ncbi:MAG: hypothetical protein ACO1OB_09545 [Archangium sp.]